MDRLGVFITRRKRNQQLCLATSQSEGDPTYIWISGVFWPAINGHHDPLAYE